MKAERIISSQGYVFILKPEHPRADERGYVFEHILVAEAALGRFLEVKHPVHHHDENRTRNVPGNLVICEDRKYHSLLHKRMRALAACGDASAHQCDRCHKYDRQENITVSGRSAYHRSCNAEQKRRQRERQSRIPS